MKQLSIIPLSLVLLVMLSLNFQGTTFAASFKGSPSGKHVTTMAPNCPSVVGKSKVTPDCTPYPRCTASGCYNLDPYAEGCGTATAYNHISIKSDPIYQDYGGVGGGSNYLWGYVYNYYSSWCIANWNLVSLSVNTSVQLIITTTDSKGHSEEVCFPNNSCGTYEEYSSGVFPAWTNMVDGTNVTSACAWVSANGGGQECADQ